MPAAWVGAAAAIGGSLLASNSASNATKAQEQASANSIAEQRREFDLNQANQQPYLDAGKQALAQYQTEINNKTTAADVMANDPGYQFGLDQGQTALDRKIAAMGGRVSGAALKGADRYATDYATTGYNSAYQRSQDRLNRLASLAGLGQTATAASAASGSASTNAITALQAAQANATASGGVAQANIWGGAANQLAALAGKYYTPTTTTNFESPGQAPGSTGVDTRDPGWSP